MDAAAIKAAVDAGQTVQWRSPAYRVTRDRHGQYHIVFVSTGDAIGLTWRDGVTLNGDEQDFSVVTSDATT